MAILRAGSKGISRAAVLGLTMLSLTTMTSATVRPVQAAPGINQAVEKYKAKDYQGALNEFKAAYAKDPKDSLCRYYMALCNQCLARVDEAKKDYQWVIEHGAPSLKANAQTGLSQLEKVNVRTGGSSAVATTAAPAAGTAASTKPGPDLIEHSKDAAKDGGKDAGKGTAAGGTKSGAAAAPKTATATTGGAVAKVINFYSDASRASQLMEGAWDEVKAKYPKITFVKVNAGEPLCEKYGVSEFPTVVVLDKDGKALQTQNGAQSTESMSSTIDTCNSKK